MHIKIGHKEAISGKVLEIDNIISKKICLACSGSGSETKKRKTCPKCKGTGGKYIVENLDLQWLKCDQCNGMTEIPEKICNVCHGERYTKKKWKISVRIPAGIKNGTRLRLKGLGDEPISDSAKKGDLFIEVNIQ